MLNALRPIDIAALQTFAKAHTMLTGEHNERHNVKILERGDWRFGLTQNR